MPPKATATWATVYYTDNSFLGQLPQVQMKMPLWTVTQIVLDAGYQSFEVFLYVRSCVIFVESESTLIASLIHWRFCIKRRACRMGCWQTFQTANRKQRRDVLTIFNQPQSIYNPLVKRHEAMHVFNNLSYSHLPMIIWVHSLRHVFPTTCRVCSLRAKEMLKR